MLKEETLEEILPFIKMKSRMIVAEYDNHAMYCMMHPLYRLIRSEMNDFILSENELFYCYVFILDCVKKGEPRKDFFLGKIDEALYKACRQLGRDSFDRIVRETVDMIWMAVATVGLPMRLLLEQKPKHGVPLKVEIDSSGKLLVCYDKEQKMRELKNFDKSPNVWDEVYLPHLESYLNSDEHLSEEICHLIGWTEKPKTMVQPMEMGSMEQKEVSKQNVEKKVVNKEHPTGGEQGEEEEDCGDLFTNRQLVLLFMAAFDLKGNSFSQVKLSELIHKVSGKSTASIRQTIMKKIDFKQQKTKDDASLVAGLIKEISPQIAEKLAKIAEK